MAEKPRLAFTWCGGCGGCEESLVDLAEDFIALLDSVDLCFCPVAIDAKKHDLEALPDGSLRASLINGCVCTDDHVEMARLLRRKSQMVVAFGACAQSGGVPGLANQTDQTELLRRVYSTAAADWPPHFALPERESVDEGRALTLPALHRRVRALHQVVDVDYTIPGCPPTRNIITRALGALLADDPPERGSVLAPDVALCDECPRKASKPADLRFTEFRRTPWADLDSDNCFLAQGVVCMGPATRGGCEAQCIDGRMPCSGCFGGTSRVRDPGAKMLSSLASSISYIVPQDIDEVFNGIPDPVGTFYRYGLASSPLRASWAVQPQDQETKRDG